jgi:hypothetical protein
MELEELKLAWQTLDARVTMLDQSQRRQTLSRPLRRFVGYPIFELISGLFFIGGTGTFLAEGPHTAQFVIPAAILHLFGIFTIAFGIWQIARLSQVDFAGPVVAIQSKLAEVKTWRVRTTQWLLIASPLLGIPFEIVGARAFLGLDVYRVFGSAWLAANLVFGILAILAIFIASRVYREAFANSKALANFADQIAGRSLVEAIRQAEAISAFERE